jgi:hypothetical protein
MMAMIVHAPTAFAEDPVGDDWTFSFTPYLWVPSIDVDAEVGGVSSGGGIDAGLSEGFGGILGNIDFAFLAHAEAQTGRYALFSDLVILQLSNDFDTAPFSVGPIQVSPVEIDADIDGTILELGGGYQFWRGPIDELSTTRDASLEIIGGVRLSRLDFDSQLSTTVSGPAGILSRQVAAALDFTVELADPIVGARTSLAVAEDWTVKLRGDIGGFGLGSDLTWNVGLAVTYQAWEHASLLFGYRALGYDFEVEEPGTSTQVDLIFHGPVVAVTFSW